MLGRLKSRGFLEAERVGTRKFMDQLNGERTTRVKTVVRVIHPVHGPMYEKIDEADEAASDAAVDRWAARANKPVEKPRKIGAK